MDPTAKRVNSCMFTAFKAKCHRYCVDSALHCTAHTFNHVRCANVQRHFAAFNWRLRVRAHGSGFESPFPILILFTIRLETDGFRDRSRWVDLASCMKLSRCELNAPHSGIRLAVVRLERKTTTAHTQNIYQTKLTGCNTSKDLGIV